MTDRDPVGNGRYGAGVRLARKLMLILLMVLVPLALVGFLAAFLGFLEGSLIASLVFVKD